MAGGFQHLNSEQQLFASLDAQSIVPVAGESEWDGLWTFVKALETGKLTGNSKTFAKEKAKASNLNEAQFKGEGKSSSININS